jgi:hypothetical protein
VGSPVIIDGAYLVATPAVKRPCWMKCRWNSSGSTPTLMLRHLPRLFADRLAEERSTRLR